MYLKEKQKEKKRKKETDRINYPYVHRSGVSFRVRLSLSLITRSSPGLFQTPR